MQILIDILMPVFLVIGFGYVFAWRGIMSEGAFDGLMSFVQNFAIPLLLFRAIWTLDLGDSFSWPLIISYYTGSLTSFVVGLGGARLVFKRTWEDSVTIGFCCLFANSVLLGLPISERAFGPDSLGANFAIIALHSPFCYGLGITTMELVRARAKGLSNGAVVKNALNAMFHNAMVIGIMVGAVFNVLDVNLPVAMTEALSMAVEAALPAALFGTGGILWRYRPDGDFRVIFFICAISLLLHPTITWTLGLSLGLETNAFNSAVLTAAMAPGINAYVFANMYGSAKRVTATSVLLANVIAIVTVSLWLFALH